MQKLHLDSEQLAILKILNFDRSIYCNQRLLNICPHLFGYSDYDDDDDDDDDDEGLGEALPCNILNNLSQIAQRRRLSANCELQSARLCSNCALYCKQQILLCQSSARQICSANCEGNRLCCVVIL